MTQKEKNNLLSTLADIRSTLSPSWHISKNTRSTIIKIMMVMFMLSKVSHRLPLKVFSQQPEAIIQVDPGEDNLLSLTEIWGALNPMQRAILVYLEIQAPSTMEALCNETQDTINQFFQEAKNNLSPLPVWGQIEMLSNSPNLPTSIPSDANEFRVRFVDDNTLNILTRNNSEIDEFPSYDPDWTLYSVLGSSGIAFSVLDYQRTEVDGLTEVTKNIVDEVFDREPDDPIVEVFVEEILNDDDDDDGSS